MKKRKCIVLLVMALLLAACGKTEPDSGVTPTAIPTTAPTETLATPTATPVPEPQNVTVEDASITFEDGNMGFMTAYMQHATSAEVEMSIVDYNGSKALEIKNISGKVPFIAIDVSSLLGTNVEKVAGVEMVMGTSYEDGSFHAVAGEIIAWYGTDLEEKKIAEWTVYMEKKNPKIATFKIPADSGFVADANNIMLINLKDDNGVSVAGINATLYIDDIRFYDEAGNTLTADTTVAFNEPAGFSGGEGPDLSNLYAISNAVEFVGFATSGGGWKQSGFEMPQEIIDALVPGSVVEIAFTSADGSMWIVMPNAEVGWSRIAQGKTYINNSATVAQITYEQIAAVCGEDKSTWGTKMQCEAKTDWEVYSVKVGTASQRLGIANPVEFEGFATSGGGWKQSGFEMPQEIIDVLVPGAVIEISYTSEDGSMWIVMPNAEAGWSRIAQGTAVCADGKAYITYEQIAAVCGEDKSTWGAKMQCEAKSNWEVYALRVGTKVEYPALSGFVNFEGFATSGGGWKQSGFEMPQEIIDVLVPGAVIEISYTSEDGSMWIVMPNAEAGWSRIAQGTAACADGKAYITYEQIAAVCGEDKSTWGTKMQCEAKTNWEVYSVRIGQTK